MDTRHPQTAHTPWKTHTARCVYENPWSRVEEHEVTNPSGNPGIYGVVGFKYLAVGVVPIDDEGHTWLVGQYRYTLGEYSWEIPEGGCPAGESPLDAARRELREETGLVARDYRLLLDGIALSNSVSDERGTLFVATGLSQGAARGDHRVPLRDRPARPGGGGGIGRGGSKPRRGEDGKTGCPAHESPASAIASLRRAVFRFRSETLWPRIVACNDATASP